MSIALTLEPIDAPAELAAFEAHCRSQGLDVGAVVSFTGQVRAEGGEVMALELEAYSGFTEQAIAGFVGEISARHSLLASRIVHRVGKVLPGQTVVFVATAASHRRGAFEACDQLMDYLKSRAPFWKKSHNQHGGLWIEPRAQDYQDAARWDAPTETIR
jgi:molybdopterin synthase catalytic subunit